MNKSNDKSNKLILFSKPNCKKCQWLKEHIDLEDHGVEVKVLTPDNVDALAELAWSEAVKIAEEEMPVLVTENLNKITGAITIKNYLLKRS